MLIGISIQNRIQKNKNSLSISDTSEIGNGDVQLIRMENSTRHIRVKKDISRDCKKILRLRKMLFNGADKSCSSVRVCILKIGIHMRGYEKYPKLNKEAILIYRYVHAFRMIFRSTEIVCHKPHDVSATMHMDSQLKSLSAYFVH